MDTITTTASLLMSNGSAQPVMVALMPNEAALIAAAPDMAEALRVAYYELAALTPRPDNAKVTDWPVASPADAECLQTAYDAIRAALAKARGAS